MDSSDSEEQNRRRKQAIEARLKEIEKEIDKNSALIPMTRLSRYEEARLINVKPRKLTQKVSNLGKFTLTIFTVTLAICVAHWVGLTMLLIGMILAAWAGRAIAIVAVIWIAYKLFLEDKN